MEFTAHGIGAVSRWISFSLDIRQEYMTIYCRVSRGRICRHQLICCREHWIY